jgi:microsomal prostaglandin-E synthase 2
VTVGVVTREARAEEKVPEKEKKSEVKTPEAKAARLAHLRPVQDARELEIVLYQYQTCPFCTKVRTFLDFHNIPYSVVEVDPLRKGEIAFSKYKKVPICVVQGVQLTESSEIISTILSLLPGVRAQVSAKEAATDATWCKWVDDHLVHFLPANIYRTPTEAIESFDYLLDPQYSFSASERFAARYIGASVMYLVTRYKLNKKYNITQPREQFYAAVNEWIGALGDRDFMSGTHRPSRADLAVYATVRSVEGTAVFGDLLQNTHMERWYRSMQAAVGHCKGTHVASKDVTRPTFPIV